MSFSFDFQGDDVADSGVENQAPGLTEDGTKSEEHGSQALPSSQNEPRQAISIASIPPRKHRVEKMVSHQPACSARVSVMQ